MTFLEGNSLRILCLKLKQIVEEKNSHSENIKRFYLFIEIIIIVNNHKTNSLKKKI